MTVAGYEQPDLPYSPDGWGIKSIDFQIVTKFDTWDFLSDNQVDLMLDEAKLTGATHIAIAVPYSNTTKYLRWVTAIRAHNMKVSHRGAWSQWQGINSTGVVSSITRSGTTATVTTSTAHGFTTGDKVVISNAVQTDYNGEYTVTVTSSTVFTYQVANSPATPATGSINWYYSWTTARDKTAAFIVANPTFFAPGDMFAMCVEPNNADSSGSYNYTFRDTKRVSGSFSYALFNQSLLDQVYYANAAFTTIGLTRQIHTWPISPSVDNTNLNGVAWYSTSGNASGLGYLDYLKYFGGYVSFDHYQSADILDAGTYAERMAYDLDAFTRSFPGCKYFQGEIGYHTEDTVSDQNQQDVLWAVSQALLAAKHVCGVNYWVNVGSTTTSLWADTSGTLTAGGRLAVRGAITQAFKNGAISSAVYGEGVLGGNRTKIDFTGSSNAFVSAVDNPALNKVDVSVIPVLSKTTLYNYVANPSFEISLTGWTNYGTYDTIERSTAQFNNGTASFRINNATAKDGGVTSSAITLAAGTYYLSAYRKLSSVVDNAHLIIRTVGGSTHGAGVTSGYPGNTNWNRVGFSFTLGSTTTVEILIGLGSYGSASDGEAYFDGIQLELGASATTYFDGSTADSTNVYYLWTGLEHASSSSFITIVPMDSSKVTVGPASSTDNALVRFDSTTGKLVQNSGAILDDSNNLSGVGTIASGAITSSGALTLTLASGNSLVVDTSTFIVDATNNRISTGTTSPQAQMDITKTSIGSTPVDTNGLVLANTTAATVGAQQYSPQVRWRGQGWKTTATAASQSVDFRSYVVPVQGTTSPTGVLQFESSVNGGTYGGKVVIDTSGRLGIGQTTPTQLLHVVGGAGADDGLLLECGSIANIRMRRTDATARNWILRVDSDRQFKIIDETAGQTRFSIDTAGDIIIGGLLTTGSLEVIGNQILIDTSSTPASASATGTTGAIRWDSSFIYVATGTNTWKRAAIATW